jgi:hypothetical protein
MKFYNFAIGRLGNAMFRYIASVMFCLFYNAEITYNEVPNQIIDDEKYLFWLNQIENGILLELQQNVIYGLTGFYQHENLIKKYKNQIIDYIKLHPTHELCVQDEKYYSNCIINHDNIILYDIVVHLRLEDFIDGKKLINPENIKTVLDKIQIKYNTNIFTFVLNKPKTEYEEKYLNFFRNKYEIIVESNDPITDYHILKNAKILVSSTSTLCWMAALMSDRLELLYLPDYKKLEKHTNIICEGIYKPIENTILYDIEYL